MLKILQNLNIFLISSLMCGFCVAADATTSSVSEVTEENLQSKISQKITERYTNLDDEAQKLHVYTSDEINRWVEQGNHLSIIGKVNQCQFVDDIEKRAKVGMSASYQHLYGELLINGICVPKNEATGIYYLQQAASIGYPASMRRLAFFYEIGRYVNEDKRKAEALMHEAAMMGYVPAKIDWGGMLLRDMGSPLDYEEAYSWLNSIVTDNKIQSLKAKKYIAQLKERMPEYAIKRAMRTKYY